MENEQISSPPSMLEIYVSRAGKFEENQPKAIAIYC